MCAINHLVANNNSACWPWVCQWRLHFASALLVGVASQACISLGPRFGAGEAPAPTRGLCGLRPPCAALPAHTRTRASRRRRRGPPATARPGAGPGNAAALGRGAGLSGRTGELPRGCGRSGEPPAADDLRAPGSPRGARRRRRGGEQATELVSCISRVGRVAIDPGTATSKQPPLAQDLGRRQPQRGGHSPLLGASGEPPCASDTMANWHVADARGGGFGNLAAKHSPRELRLLPGISKSTFGGTEACWSSPEEFERWSQWRNATWE
ncbi:uncharacterized protein LOC130828988 isoform X1 [Hippopotamus amphibius kiboko]|uniref:uncharacterized protein LOC130828988 isoform X1 n=1 Tax=Hippopotamus amphibius kiboko TaxID=575201 RepID=UPI0025962A16|nr:uncharacterized protein LOC130828988 isoform X1 [Hippopotamus amphibius kiboko]